MSATRLWQSTLRRASFVMAVRRFDVGQRLRAVRLRKETLAPPLPMSRGGTRTGVRGAQASMDFVKRAPMEPGSAGGSFEQGWGTG